MGTIKQGILGGFSGKVGTVIGSSWKGITYMRGMAPSHSDNQSQRQLEQRFKFAVTMKFLQPLSEFIRLGFKDYAIKMTAMNAAFGYNFRNALTGAYPNYEISYASALLSRGILAPALNPVASSTVAGTVIFNWDNNSDETNANASDKTLLVVFNTAKNQAVFFGGSTERANVTQSVTVPDSFSGDQVQCYITFITPDGQLLSNSTYAGAVTVA